MDICQAKNFIVTLEGLTAADLEQAGGKGANLGELIRAGFPVPPGFVITTDAYLCFVENNCANPIAASPRPDPSDLERLRLMFEAAPIPAVIERGILAAYVELGSGPVAVRSSATAEDLPQAAFAGQQDTYLNVIGEPALLEVVRGCWGSLWNERAIAYRTRQGIDQQTLKLAVVVQKMIPADAAGVMFTANPVSGERAEIVIDANPGLGEAVVSGAVTPDHFVVRARKGRLEITEQRPGRREVIIQARPEGGTQRIEGHHNGNSSSITKPRLLELARMGLAIQRHFGAPQDIEWAVKAGKLYILQARPITALPDQPPHANRLVRILAAMFSEMFPLRPYPLDQTTWIPALSEGAVGPLFELIGISVTPVQDFFDEEDGVVTTFSGRIRMRPTPTVLLAPARLLWRSLRYDPLLAQSDATLIHARKEAQRLETLGLRAMQWGNLLEVVEQALALERPLAGEIRQRYLPRAILATALAGIMVSALGLRRRYSDLTSISHSSTHAANDALKSLADRVRPNPQLAEVFRANPPERLITALNQQPGGKAFLAELDVFLERFGHREVVLSSVLQPTWKDAPEIVLGLIQGMAQEQSQPRTGEQVGETARGELLAHPLMSIPGLRRFMLHLIASARALWQVREDTHFEATRILPVLRRTFIEMGQRLVKREVISAPEEIFHFRFDELKEIDEPETLASVRRDALRETVQRRKAKRASLERIPVIDPRLFQPANLDREAILTGTPGSPGVADGPVCIITSASEFGRLQNGDVLVAPYTNPAWTPLFQRAAAVVVDGGAAASHAAIVAREYGLPAVMGTVDGTQRLTNGQRVRVDGSRGLVFALEQKQAANG